MKLGALTVIMFARKRKISSIYQLMSEKMLIYLIVSVAFPILKQCVQTISITVNFVVASKKLRDGEFMCDFLTNMGLHNFN